MRNNPVNNSGISKLAIDAAIRDMQVRGMSDQDIGKALFVVGYSQLAKSQGADLALWWMSETLSDLSRQIPR